MRGRLGGCFLGGGVCVFAIVKNYARKGMLYQQDSRNEQ